MIGISILQVPGDAAADKADMLAEGLQGILEDLDSREVRVIRLSYCAELRVQSFDNSVLPREVAFVVAKLRVCNDRDVRVSKIRSSSRDLDSVCVRYSVVVTRRIAKKGKFRLGWVVALMDLFDSRLMWCYGAMVLHSIDA